MDLDEFKTKYMTDISLAGLNKANKESSGIDRERLSERLGKARKSTSITLRKDKIAERYANKRPGINKQQMLDEVHRIRRDVEIMQEKTRKMLGSVKNKNLRDFLVDVAEALSGGDKIFNIVERTIKNTWE